MTRPSALSVIIPIKRPRLEALEKTIKSVLSQRSVEIEVVVVGTLDHSTDRFFSSTFHGVRWLEGEDNGIYEAMNKGIAWSKGQYLLFLGAGDYLVTDEVAGEMLRRGGGAEFIYGKVVDEDLGVVGEAFSKWKLCRRNIPHQAIFYSRYLFDELAIYDTRYQILADYEYNMRCFGANVMRVFVDRVVSVCAGGGISKRVRDTVFETEKERLIVQHLGWAYGLAYGLARRAKGCLTGRNRKGN